MDTRDRMIHYLQDAQAAEEGLVGMLDDAAELCDEPARSAIRMHQDVTRGHAERLERRLEQLGGDASDAKGMVNNVLAKFGSLMDLAHDEADRRTLALIKCYASEQLEIGMYEAMAGFAETIGDQETANLAREIQREENRFAQEIFPMIRQYAAVPAGLAAQRDSYPYPGP